MTRSAKRQLVVLGSTGSIGVNTLDVVGNLNELSDEQDYEIVGLAAGNNFEKLVEQAKSFDVPFIAIADSSRRDDLQAALPKAKVFVGEDAAQELVENTNATDTIAAVVGAAGLPATLAAVKQGQRISLSNKETLVAAGPLVIPAARKHGATIIPVDSEHSAIFQCLSTESGALDSSQIKRIVLTASGGPFRTASKEEIENATVEQALNHPTWDMGPKITIDSATMMNKALEIIEAHWLFGLPSEKIGVIVHPQSVAHSFVEYVDHSVLAQLGPPDMRTPIQYALTYPRRSVGCSRAMDWTTLSTLVFEQPDFERFPALKLAYDVIEAEGTAGAVFNAANEAAVAAFLGGQLRFGQIVELVAEALAALNPRPLVSLDDVVAADTQARAFVNDRLASTVKG